MTRRSKTIFLRGQGAYGNLPRDIVINQACHKGRREETAIAGPGLCPAWRQRTPSVPFI